MNGYIKVKDHSDLVRDSKTNAILNTNSDLYMAAKLRRKRDKNQAREVQQLRRDVDEIKSLLKELINNKNQ